MCISLRTSNCFPSYAFSGLDADGDPFRKIKSCFFANQIESNKMHTNLLDFKN
jgi:hypothetical protein